jgi:hypothetical protein
VSTAEAAYFQATKVGLALASGAVPIPRRRAGDGPPYASRNVKAACSTGITKQLSQTAWRPDVLRLDRAQPPSI